MNVRNAGRCFGTALMLFASMGIASAQNEKVLSLNSVQGIKETMDKSATRTLKITTGAGNTTDGDGALQLQGVSTQREGNRYFGIMVPLGRTWDLTKVRLAVDARSSQAENNAGFYLRGYNQGETQASFSFSSWSGLLTPEWKTFHFQRGGRGSELAWESTVVGDRIPNRVDRIEFIVGTSKNGVPVDLQLDNLRIMPPIVGIADLNEPKVVQRTVSIADGAQAQATILHPDSAVGREAAQKIVAAVRAKTGAGLSARAATEADREFKGNVILLGNATNNPALFLLYTRRFVPVDQICPGPGGSLMQTVHDPFGGGGSAVVVGASDDAGLQAATAAFIARVQKTPAKTVAFPKFFEAKYSPEFLKRYGWAGQKEKANRFAEGLKAAQDALDQGKHTSIAGELRTAALRYQLTGSSTEARLFVALWELYGKSAVSDASKYGGPWGFDSDFPSYEVVSGWDNIEEDPSLTDEQRLLVTREMARWLTDAVVPKASVTEGRVAFNHQTFPALGVLRAGLYYSQSYPGIQEGSKWLEQADRVFRNQAKFYKPFEDCNTYQWLTNGHMLTYAVSRPDFTVFKNGNAERVTDYCIATMNNMGYQVPYGDTGVWSGSSAENTPLSVVAFMTGNRNAAWASDLKTNLRGGFNLYSFQKTWDAPTPQSFNGVKMWPLDAGYANTFLNPSRPADNQLFDKVSFRGALDREAPYMLLDGLNNGGHGHYDGNSIEQLTQYDRIWLADNDYFKSHVKYHNSMQILRDGQASALPPYAALLGHGETNDYGYSHSRLSGYSGAGWDRYIIQLKKSDAFLVLDKVTAEQDGEYQFRLLWHGVGDARLTEDGLLLKQKGPSMWFQVARGPQLGLINDADLGKNWSSYPHAEAVVRSMNATARVRLNKGQHYLFASVFHGSKTGEAAPWKLNFTQGYNGVALSTGREALEVKLQGDQIALQSSPATATAATLQRTALQPASAGSTPGVTTFLEPQSNAAARSTFTAKAAASPTPLAPAPANLSEKQSAPAFREVWSLKPAAQELLLTGNSGQAGAVKNQAGITVDPQPQAGGNVLDVSSANHVGALLDGQVDSTGQAVMFPAGRKVSVTLDLHRPSQITKVDWRMWWARTSSRQSMHMLDNAVVQLSNDNFKNDTRTLGTVPGGEHPDWGTPVSYEVAGKGETARYVRIVLTPRANSSIYLAEVGVKGKVENAEVADFASQFTGLTSARLQKGAPQTLLATTAEGLLQAVSPEGKLLWSKSFSTPLNDVAAGDVNGDGIDEIAIARQDGNTTLLDATGKELWSKQLQYYRRPPYVNLVRMGDLDGDGKAEVVSGGENWRFYAYDGTGKELWQFETVHPSRSGVIADLNGDGKQEVVAGTHYYTSTVLSNDGKRVWAYRLGPIAYDIATGNFDGNKTRGVVFGAGDGIIHYTDSTGDSRLKFDTGDEVHEVEAADLDGDGKDEILAASDNGYLYCFGADKKLRWLRPLDTPATALTTAQVGGSPVVLVGTRSGHLMTFDAKGELQRQSALNSGIRQLFVTNGIIVVTTADGRMMRVEP